MTLMTGILRVTDLEINLSKDSYEVSPREMPIFLGYLAGLWQDATNGLNENETFWHLGVEIGSIAKPNLQVMETYENVMRLALPDFKVEEKNGNQFAYELPFSPDLQAMFNVWTRYSRALKSVDTCNPVNVSVSYTDNHLTLGWDGAWTLGRYAYLTVFSDGSGLFEWDSATENPSRFLGIENLFEKVKAIQD